MNRRIPFDHWIILSLTVLLGMGLVVVYNASSIDYLGRQLVAAVLGIALLCIAMKINYRIFNRSVVVFLLATFSAGLLLLPLLMSDPVNGAHRWINIRGYTFQPSELAKIVLIILTAHFLASYHKSGKKATASKYLICVYFFFATALTGLVLLGNDLSTAVLMALIILIMTFLGGLRLHVILGAAAMGSAAVFFLR